MKFAPRPELTVALHFISLGYVKMQRLPPYFLLPLLTGMLLLPGCALPGRVPAPPRDSACRHVLLLGDPHLPGSNMPLKERVRDAVNSWPEVELIVALGDICETSCTEAELTSARDYLAGMRAPVRPITGNHDFFYADIPNEQGRQVPAAPEIAAMKLQKFRETFQLATLSESRLLGHYLLLFLSADTQEHLVGLSQQQLAWLDEELSRHSAMPAIIFFHAPLRGTLRQYKSWVNQPHTVAQPEDTLHALLNRHPQVFLWVSGHTHTTPREESFASQINRYDGRILNLHNPAMNRETIWTNLLRLCPDGVTIRTFDHQQQTWLHGLDRHIPQSALPNSTAIPTLD